MTASSDSDLPHSLKTLLADRPEIHVLDNGLTVVCQPNTAHQLFSAQVWIRTGSIHENAHLGSGLSHYLEHMLFKGTERRGPGVIAREVQQFGGQINAYTAFDRTVYYIDGPSEALDQSLDILNDMVFFSKLPEDEVRKEKDVILREIDMTMDDPDRILSRSLFATAYRQHPFRFPVIGLRPLFERVDREMLARYYLERYQPANTVLSVVGEFDVEELLESVNKTFGEVPRGTNSPVVIPEEATQLALRESRKTGDYQTARGILGFKIPSMRHPDAPGFDILASMIGSGYSARLRQKLRDELGLVHSISSSAWNPGDPGLFIVSFRSEPEKAEAAENAIRSSLVDFTKELLNQEELDKSRRFALVSEIQSRQSCSGVASKLGLLTALVGDLNFPERYFRRIHEMDLPYIREIAGKAFKDDHLNIATLLPESFKKKRTASSQRQKLPEFSEKTLSNGARLLWQRDSRLPRTYIRYAGLGGPLYEDRQSRGATSLLATILTKDTRFKTATDVARELENEGGFLLDASGNNTFALATEVMPESALRGLRALQDAVCEPGFLPATIAREREAQLAHLKNCQDEILDRGRLSLREKFFGDHPFASDPCGSIDSVERLDQACLKKLYKKLVVAPNAVLSITGDFDPETLLPKAEAMLKNLPGGEFEVCEAAFSGPARTGEVVETFEREQAVVIDAFPDCGFLPEEEITGELLDEILSDMSGPLFHAVREDRSLAYYVSSSRLLGYNFGLFHLYAGTQPSTTKAVFECFDTELARIRNGDIKTEEFEAARTRLRIQNRFALQSPSTRGARASLNALYKKPIMDWLDYEERLNKVRVEDISGFARKYLVPEKRLRYTIGPKID